jgi:hypothetical protein
MKIEVNIEKRYALMLLGFALLLAGVFFVYAYNSGGSGGTPSVMGHSVDEINFAQTITSVKSRDIVMGTGSYTVEPNDYELIRLVSSQGRVGGLMHSRDTPYGINSFTIFAYDGKDLVLRPVPASGGGTPGDVIVKGGNLIIEDGTVIESTSGSGLAGIRHLYGHTVCCYSIGTGSADWSIQNIGQPKGVARVVFDTPFPSRPTVVATPYFSGVFVDNEEVVLKVYDVQTNGFRVEIKDALGARLEYGFSFHVLGEA